MAKELSSTLRNLKFMQRATKKEESTKKEETSIPDGNFPSPSLPRKCMVIMEGDPHPGAIKGRMSFQSFNPSIDKLHEAMNPNRQENTTSSSMADRRENGSESLTPDSDISDGNGELKRKQAEVISEMQYPNKSPKNDQDSSTSKSNASSSSCKQRKQRKHEKVDWNVLRPPKSQR